MNNYKISCPYCNKEIDLNNLDLSKDKHIQEYINNEVSEKLKTEKQSLQLKNQEELNKAYKEQENKIKLTLENDFLIKEQKNGEVIGGIKEQLKQYQEKEKTWNEDRKELLKKYDALIEALNNSKKDITKSLLEAYDIRFKNETKEYTDKIDELQNEIKKLSNVKNKGNATEKDVLQFLKDKYETYNDKIDPVSPGKSGADIIHIVKTNGQESKKIYYEIKNTANYISTWEDKFIKNFNAIGATFGAIITKSIPKEKENNGEYIWELEKQKGIYICSFDAYRPLCMLLRKIIFDTETLLLTQSQEFSIKDELYKKVNSTEFLQVINKINKLIKDNCNELTILKNSFNKSYGNLNANINDIETTFTELIAKLNLNL